MATDTLFFLVRAQAVRAILTTMPEDRSSWRETDIQVAKLERMVADFHHRFLSDNEAPVPLLASRSVRKQAGTELRAIDQQAKLMHCLFLRTMEEDLFARRAATIDAAPRKRVRCLLRWMNSVLEQKLYEITQELKKRISAGESPGAALVAATQAIFEQTPPLAA